MHPGSVSCVHNREAQNLGTVVLREAPRPRLDPAQLYIALALARTWLDVHAPPPTVAAGFRLFWSRGAEIEWCDLGSDASDARVIGRHTACDIHLRGDDELSLRHLLALPVTLTSGEPALRLVDLEASLPFFLDDDVPRRGLIATGPFALRIGRWVLGGIPIAGASGEHLRPQSLRSSSAGFNDSIRFEALPRSVPPPRPALCPTLAPVTLAGTHVSRRQSGSPVVVLRIRRASGDDTLPLDEVDLQRGVLLGRYDRCATNTLWHPLPDSLSRVHLLLLRDGRDLLAIDLASTNGSSHGDRGFRALRLPCVGVSLRLAGEPGVTVEW